MASIKGVAAGLVERIELEVWMQTGTHMVWLRKDW